MAETIPGGIGRRRTSGLNETPATYAYFDSNGVKIDNDILIALGVELNLTEMPSALPAQPSAVRMTPKKKLKGGEAGA